ncbi:branched-chain amino acid ABC transporter permease [Rhodobacteraceae bacterium NNCM2]|nr:branched-chain amino acid ABC transporter permease [Coraliihabitans acroporae]
MFYREAGEFKTSYVADQATFPIRFDFWRFWLVVAFAFLVVPFFIDSYWEKAILLPFLIYGLAALGLNILTGYCGQVSLGTGGFMAVGAYASYKLMTGFPGLDMTVVILASGFITAGVGILFGLPSLRIKGFYLAVATLAAQFFLVWLFNKWEWAYNYSPTGQITAPPRTAFGIEVTGAATSSAATYLFCLMFLFVFGWVATNLVRGRIGRQWMAIRDMDIAAEIIGVNPLMAKLSAFAISSFYIGMAGALYFSVWNGAAEPTESFAIDKSFDVLFMIILGGLGSIFGSLVGAAFIVLLPVLFKNVLAGTFGWPTDIAEHLQIIIVGALIIFFLIKEPEGLAAYWRLAKEKLRLWPFPH